MARLTIVRAALIVAALLGACAPSTSSAPRDASVGALDAPAPPGADADASRPRTRVERYVRGDTDPRLVIELDFVEGTLPRASAEADLVARLRTLLDKPAGIEIVHDDEIPSRGADHAWTPEEIDALAIDTFDDAGPPGTITMHVMWLDGHDVGDSSAGATLGVAWSHTHVVMYHDTIESNCMATPLLGDMVCAQAQYAIWLHETGHLLGLVDNGAPMVTPHRDLDRGAHDQSSSCVMYWAFDTQTGLDLIESRLLGGAPMLDFDAECVADLRALRDAP